MSERESQAQWTEDSDGLRGARGRLTYDDVDGQHGLVDCQGPDMQAVQLPDTADGQQRLLHLREVEAQRCACRTRGVVRERMLNRRPRDRQRAQRGGRLAGGHAFR